MSWDQFYNSFKKKAIYAADKINQTADIATLQVKLSLAEHKLNEAYADLGKVAYAHFTSESNEADAVAKAMAPVEIALANVNALKKEIEAKKAESTSKSEEKEPGDKTEDAQADSTENAAEE